MARTLATDYTVQTPQMTLHEIADKLWKHGEHAAYRSLMAYVKEREQMLDALEELQRSEPK